MLPVASETYASVRKVEIKKRYCFTEWKLEQTANIVEINEEKLEERSRYLLWSTDSVVQPEGYFWSLPG